MVDQKPCRVPECKRKTGPDSGQPVLRPAPQPVSRAPGQTRLRRVGRGRAWGARSAARCWQRTASEEAAVTPGHFLPVANGPGGILDGCRPAGLVVFVRGKAAWASLALHAAHGGELREEVRH